LLVTNSETIAAVGDYARITAEGNVEIKAASDSKMVTVLAGLAGSAGSGAAVGATISVNVFNRLTEARSELMQ
jgi:hypothetical protein